MNISLFIWHITETLVHAVNPMRKCFRYKESFNVSCIWPKNSFWKFNNGPLPSNTKVFRENGYIMLSTEQANEKNSGIYECIHKVDHLYYNKGQAMIFPRKNYNIHVYYINLLMFMMTYWSNSVQLDNPVKTFGLFFLMIARFALCLPCNRKNMPLCIGY